MAVALLLSAVLSLSLAAGDHDTFLNAASKYVNDKPGLIDLYVDHHQAHSENKVSELDLILEDMVSYCKDNEDTNAPRHIVTVLADDMGFADIGYNDPTMITPTLDTMAGNGVKFDNFYVQSTCTPTRASLLTGLDTQKTGLQDAAIIPGESRSLPLSLKVAGNYFQEAGYTTNFIGKWHLGQRYLNATAPERGYDYFFGVLGGTIDSYTKKIGLQCGSKENNFTDIFGDNCQLLNAYDFQEQGTPFLDFESYASDVLTDKAIARINAQDKSKGMLLHYHTNAPHAPLVAPQKLIDICSGASAPAPDSFQPYFRQVICGMVASVDIDVLRIIFGLANKGMLQSTLFQFSSDNGGLTVAGSLNTPYRSQKGALFEGGIRSAAFMFGNGLHLAHVLNGERTGLVSVQDVLPTLLGYAGISVGKWLKNPFDGYNMWPQLVSGLPLLRTHVPVSSATMSLGLASAYIQKIGKTTWKYLINPSVIEFVATSALGETYTPEGEFLFNLSEDPYETTNLATDKSVATVVVLNLLRLRVLGMRLTGAPSQITEVPPPIDLPPSPLGCWLPLDSPIYMTYDCSAAPGEKVKGVFAVGDHFVGYGASDETNQYVTAAFNI